jgi:hypothetical protein
MSKGLTKAQLRILRFLASVRYSDRLYCFGDSWHWVTYYENGPRTDRRSCERLLEEGYIECVLEGRYSNYYNITESGRQALAEQGG